MKITRENLKNIVREAMIDENEYQEFFKKALEKTGKSIPQMSDEEKKTFFNKIEASWKGKGEKNERFGRGVEGPTFGSDNEEDLDEEAVVVSKRTPEGNIVSKLKEESVNEADNFAGWIAIDHRGKKIEIKKGEAKDLYNAKLLAIKKLKVPKSKIGLLAIKPAVDESVNEVDTKKANLLRKNMPGYVGPKFAKKASDEDLLAMADLKDEKAQLYNRYLKDVMSKISKLQKKYNIKESIVNEAQVVNKKTGKDITKHVLDLMSGKIDKKTFEKLTGLKNESMDINEDDKNSFVAFIDTNKGKKLLKVFKTQQTAKRFVKKNMDNMLNTKGVESIGTMSKKEWDTKEAKYAIK